MTPKFTLTIKYTTGTVACNGRWVQRGTDAWFYDENNHLVATMEEAAITYADGDGFVVSGLEWLHTDHWRKQTWRIRFYAPLPPVPVTDGTKTEPAAN